MAQWNALTAAPAPHPAPDDGEGDAASHVPEGDQPAQALIEDEPHAGWQPSLLRWIVIPFTLLALLVVTSYIARSRFVLGPLLRERLVAEASARGVDLYIEDVDPAGLFGVRFERVRARLNRGSYTLDTRLNRLEIRPSLSDLVQGRVLPQTLVFRGGEIIIERTATPRLVRAGRAISAPVGVPPNVRIIGRDITLKLKAGRAFASTRPLKLDRVEAVLPLSGTPIPEELFAAGELPDGERFELKSAPAAGGVGRQITLTPARRTRLDAWFLDQLPFQVSTDRIEVCSGCATDEIRMNAPQVRLPTFGRGLLMTTDHAQLNWEHGQAALVLPDVTIQGLEDPDLGVSITHTRFVFDVATGDNHGQLDIADRGRGTLRVGWRWEADRRWWSAEVVAGRFALKELLTLLELDPIVREGALLGTLNATFDGAHGLLVVEPALTMEGVDVLIEPLSAERLKFERVFFGAQAALDLNARALSITGGRLTLGHASPLRFDGSLIGAEQGWRFHLNAHTSAVAPGDLISALPQQISRPVVGAKLSGLFDAHLNLSGHSAFPDSLRMDVGFGGQVQVLSDDPQANIGALAQPGPPVLSSSNALLRKIDTSRWLPYEAMPEHLPRVLLSAEDAAFFRHDGFDLGGIRRAMVHNLKVGRMERGGSTITQQLIKSLYLSRDRTLARKLQEAYLTWRIENALSKQRILELYMNVVHWGEGVYGIEQAAQTYFKRPAIELTIEQMALLSAILPNPDRFGGHLLRGEIASSRVTKFEHILSNLKYLGMITSEQYYDMHGRALHGDIGGLTLRMCDDDGTAPMGSPPCKREQP
jgi:monofunctional biosynthetic peptidoglycan transglycosylase